MAEVAFGFARCSYLDKQQNNNKDSDNDDDDDKYNMKGPTTKLASLEARQSPQRRLK
jgi:hypothetical protein